MNTKNLYTPKEICDKYPQLNFLPQDVGALLRIGVVTGKSSKRQTLIYLESFEELMQYRNKLIDKTKI